MWLHKLIARGWAGHQQRDCRVAPRAWGLRAPDPVHLPASLLLLFERSGAGPRPCAGWFRGVLGEASAPWSELQAPALTASRGRGVHSWPMEGSQPGPCPSCPALPTPAPALDAQQEPTRIIFPVSIGSVGWPSQAQAWWQRVCSTDPTARPQGRHGGNCATDPTRRTKAKPNPRPAKASSPLGSAGSETSTATSSASGLG